MTIRLYKADKETHVEFFPKAASETFTFNDLVYVNSSGYITKAVDGSAIRCLGLIQKTIAATDSDYASNTRVPVLVPGPHAVFLCDVSTGSAAQTDVGEEIDIDDHNSVDVSASTYDIFQVTAVISTTQVLAKLNLKTGAVSTV